MTTLKQVQKMTPEELEAYVAALPRLDMESIRKIEAEVQASKTVTREQFIKYMELKRPILKEADRDIRWGSSFADRGAQRRHEIAVSLYEGLKSGYVPTTYEVVGYFGKGVRFSK